MIRPFTFLCFLLACGSGLYLYQSKHRVEMLDHQIEQTVHATDQLREQTRVLHAEWTLLNDPQRLQALADQFLNLKPVAPGQFTSVAELDNRLPAVKAPELVPAEPTGVPVAQAPETTQLDAPQPAPVANAAPTSSKPVSVTAIAAITPKPASVSAAAPTPRVAEPRPPARQQLAEAAPLRPAPPVRRPMVAMELPRAAPTRIFAAAMPAAPPSAPFTGSALGMAHIAAPPLPRPMPVSTQQWASGGGGGG